MVLACISLFQDWSYFYNGYYGYMNEIYPTPILNIMFFTSVVFLGAFTFIYHIFNNNKENSAFVVDGKFHALIRFSLPALIIILIFTLFRLEISLHFDQLVNNSIIKNKEVTHENYALRQFEQIWLNNYSLLFFSLLGLLNLFKIKNNILGNVTRFTLLLFTVVFLFTSLYAISDLREIYLNPKTSPYFPANDFYIVIRYISMLFLALGLYVLYLNEKARFIHPKFPKILDCIIHISILWIASSELINWLDMGGYTNHYKLGLSILWGSYALLLIILGIWKKKQYFRIGGIALFGITLVKLFFYDISNLETISKTILFVSLGVLLLIISFLYNKYKHKIFPENENDDQV